MSYTVGDSINLKASFYDASNVLTDPTSVSVKVQKPDGTETNYAAPTHDGLGLYSQAISLDQAGRWRHKWTATGAVTAVEEGEFFVETTSF